MPSFEAIKGLYLLDEPVDTVHDIRFLVQRIHFGLAPLMRGVVRVIQYLTHGTIRCAAASPSKNRLSSLEFLNAIGHVALADN
jgi:hypothetical protein